MFINIFLFSIIFRSIGFFILQFSFMLAASNNYRHMLPVAWSALHGIQT